MLIIRYRATIMAAAAGSLVVASGPALAQIDQRTAANIMVECSKIGDPTARLACYDNNVRNIDPGAPMPPPSTRAGVGGGAPAAQPGPQGFGFESVKQREERFTPVAPSQQQVSATVSAAVQREPGVYLVTLSDGAQWLFSEGVDYAYRPPRRGQTIEIERGAMGGYLMRIEGQKPVPVRRMR
ncbi:hypothetical protein [Altererythrobacter sp. Root672]|uniref:hypothetical protein n=1 Tax=Altererythrobacter sp. Root672 TaxID=1736584 RepID=UPI0006F5453C|nr:hypothetical protein [Altererythrobacter sp. Root672]KRA83261.1 hypothetical protein ASD76_04160 [Altererythrobacter sp. Root672]